MPRQHGTWSGAGTLCALSLLVLLVSTAVPAWAATASPVSDSLYDAHHPRLLLTPAELPNLRMKLKDGGWDDAAYTFVSGVVQSVYPFVTLDSLLDDDFALEAVPNLGLVMYLAVPRDSNARARGKQLTQYIADNWDVDTDSYGSSLRLRALVLGYDMFFDESKPVERGAIRDEIRSYLDYMLTNANYAIWGMRPYLSNKTAMVAAAVGLAAIGLDGETDATIVTSGLQRAADLFNTWLTYQVDSQGACREGALYGAWSLRNLIYYFHARLRYDGVDYRNVTKLRNMERWFAYELDPLGGGRVNNIQDCTLLDLPLPRHTTYFDWAQTSWRSGLSHYIWAHVAGEFGFDKGDHADKVATMLWWLPIADEQPDAVLPGSFLWEDRGLYYYRSGWPAGAQSDDVVFSFYSGKFEGGHAQEDQNQFTLTAYGHRFITDHGPGVQAKESEAHNMILIDGNGQHNAGSSIGTDGRITDYVLGRFADYVVGDATDAYSTHSALNDPNVPLAGADWSWGYTGANPVNFARRKVVAVHGPSTPPYFFIVDGIDKDGTVHDYEWRMHTQQDNGIDMSANPIRISSGAAYLDVHVLNPPFAGLAVSTAPFDNGEEDPNSTVVSLATTAVNPEFALLLLPGDATVPYPSVFSSRTGDVLSTSVVWPGGETDVLLVNLSGGPVAVAPAPPPASRVERSGREPQAASALQPAVPVSTDASLAVLRFRGGALVAYLLVGATDLSVGPTPWVRVHDGPADVSWSSDRIDLNRFDADFVLFAPSAPEVFFRQQRIYVTVNGDYLMPASATGIPAPRPPPAGRIAVRVHPNPFNPTTGVTITRVRTAPVDVVVYDVQGRMVRRLHRGRLPAGESTLVWDGRDGAGRPVASGVYLLRVRAPEGVASNKLILLK